MRRFIQLSSRWMLPIATARCVSSAASTSASDLVIAKESPLEKVFILEMNNPKANVLSPDFISAFLSQINTLCDPDKERSRGIILTSAVTGIFSGGLDINELFNNQEQGRFAHYWNQFQQLFTTIHTLPIPLMAAINGHAAAAGCIISLACDYRVMACTHPKNGKNLTIGISATKHGFCVPPYVVASLEHVVGFRKAEEIITNGLMLTAQEALEYGLVDHVVEGADEAIVPCLEEMEKILQLPSPVPYWIAKDFSRRQVVAPLSSPALRQADTVNFYRMMQDPTVRSVLGKHIAGLGSKKTTSD
ncbi:3,2-trans-enoyl-CoA isomerase, mitochondrial [Strigomonas culicis]|uniref:Enoyl-CoA delta isomerase 1, mitochondrial n=1 Tax=Strigomonas culicis TaxID=28005 RepID=S9V192_9TRYP|nr:3,2-trans-enoyl-CoA isomerase, mitochondrial [Strigomonas culicis]EPY26725.1 3,2-trans-enoyl-CoA isomerase [Strigomonas culicis]EPY34778.1 3,2-trans-enoyl-CoA isomerase [Strigomonas culicis]EPY35583.1 3,2-trans-enoyl-CoA isomerase, mitochondrial [Strigomonas culicis]|eukprot:EPY23673.1 3,2-trans-enoyl-CoA isomerase, mitochondrial [Strigomonas culicis]